MCYFGCIQLPALVLALCGAVAALLLVEIQTTGSQWRLQETGLKKVLTGPRPSIFHPPLPPIANIVNRDHESVDLSFELVSSRQTVIVAQTIFV